MYMFLQKNYNHHHHLVRRSFTAFHKVPLVFYFSSSSFLSSLNRRPSSFYSIYSAHITFGFFKHWHYLLHFSDIERVYDNFLIKSLPSQSYFKAHKASFESCWFFVYTTFRFLAKYLQTILSIEKL